ncbi:MAG: hypothetical protein LLF87_02140 [Eubacteriales bacterium]|nr:hypothetical protein [Eubacteriales bacterium]
MGKYFLEGYAPPTGVNSDEKVKELQASLGVKQDGIWGPVSQAAWEKRNQTSPAHQPAYDPPDHYVDGYLPPLGVTDRYKVRKIQATLGVRQDGVWGKQTQAAWKEQFGGLWSPSVATNKTRLSQQNYNVALEDGDSVDDAEAIRTARRILGVSSDSMRGPKPQTAWDALQETRGSESPAVQRERAVMDDSNGIRGSKPQVAWDTLQETRSGESPTVQRKRAVMDDLSEQYSGHLAEIKRADIYLGSEQREKRYPLDNTCIETMGTLYRMFMRNGHAEDAQNILAHMALYNDAAAERKQNGSEEYKAESYLIGGSAYGWNIYDPPRIPPTSSVRVSIVNRAPLFGLSSYKPLGQTSFEAVWDTVSGFVPVVNYFAFLASVAKKFQWKGYFEFNPEAILESGDVVIHYTPRELTAKEVSINSDLGTTYAFRGSELLYTKASNATPILGKNYMKYAEKYKEDVLSANKDLFLEELAGYILEYAFMKRFPK